MVSAFKIFFKKAINNVQDEADTVKVEYDTFEQVTAKKFDSRIQLVFQKKGYSQDSKDLEHPNYLTDELKTQIFRQIVRQKHQITDLIEGHPWPDQY